MGQASLIEEREDAPSSPSPVEQDRPGWPRRVWQHVWLPLLAALPALAGLVDVCRSLGTGRYLPYADHAILELKVREVGSKPVLVGAWSRFGWDHPGPLEHYVLAVPYRILGEAHQALAIGTLLIAGVSSVGIVLLVRRHAGLPAALWATLVLAVTVRLLPEGFLRDSWNPELPLLPLALYALLCWSALCGDAWALPVAALPGSLAAQAHLGYVTPVALLAVVTVAVLIGQRVLARRRAGGDGAEGADGHPRPSGLRAALGRWWRSRWARAGGLTFVLTALLWSPPIYEELTRHPGNLTMIRDYLADTPTDGSLSGGVRAVADHLAKLPSYVVGVGRPSSGLLPQRWPVAAIVVALACVALAAGIAVFRRRRTVLLLGVVTAALAVAGVVSVANVRGLSFTYLVQWLAVVGLLAWIFVGAALLPEVRRRARLLTGALLAVAVAATLVTASGAYAAHTPQTDETGDLQAVADAALTALDASGGRHQTVLVNYAASTRPTFIGTALQGAGLVLALERAGVDPQVSPWYRHSLGPERSDRRDQATYAVTLAYSNGGSPPPAPGERVLGVSGRYAVYGGPLPVRGGR